MTLFWVLTGFLVDTMARVIALTMNAAPSMAVDLLRNVAAPLPPKMVWLPPPPPKAPARPPPLPAWRRITITRAADMNR
jgi:hypothetical protein